MATAQFNGTVTGYTASTDEEAQGPAPVAFTTRVELREPDLVAALFQWFDMGMAPAELDDDGWVRTLVAEGLMNVGLLAIADTHAEMAKVEPGSAAHTWLTLCHRRVREVFTPDAAPLGVDRRELAGVNS